MKRILTGILAAALLLSIGTTSALAAGTGHRRNDTDEGGNGICNYTNTACAYADENGDGICDFCDSQTCPGREQAGDHNSSCRSGHEARHEHESGNGHRRGSGHGCRR